MVPEGFFSSAWCSPASTCLLPFSISFKVFAFPNSCDPTMVPG